MKRKFIQPKVVHIYPNPNTERCLVRLYEKYIGLLPTSLKHDALYMQPKLHVMPECWYIDLPVGINHIRSTVNRLCALVGRVDGKYVNQRLTNEIVDTVVVKELG